MIIHEFDMLVLSYISRHKYGCSIEELSDKFGSEVPMVTEELTKNQLIRVYDNSLKPFMRNPENTIEPEIGSILTTQLGKLEVKRWSTKNLLTTKEKWKERLWGFLSGVLLAILTYILRKYF